MTLPEEGDKVTVVITGTVRHVDREGGTSLFDVDYGPGLLVAAESQLLEESPLVRKLVETARRGVAWHCFNGEGARVCPRCYGPLRMKGDGNVCGTCKKELLKEDVVREAIESALDALCDHLVDAGLDRDRVWEVRRDKADEIIRDATAP